jgi:hypothetical protein
MAAARLVPNSAKARKYSEAYAAERRETPQLRWNNDAASSADDFGGASARPWQLPYWAMTAGLTTRTRSMGPPYLLEQLQQHLAGDQANLSTIAFLTAIGMG